MKSVHCTLFSVTEHCHVANCPILLSFIFCLYNRINLCCNPLKSSSLAITHEHHSLLPVSAHHLTHSSAHLVAISFSAYRDHPSVTVLDCIRCLHSALSVSAKAPWIPTLLSNVSLCLGPV